LTERQTPDFVVVGHVCQDLLPDGSFGLGGSVSYATATAQQMGYRVGVVTSAGPDLDLEQALPGAEIVCHPSQATTVFENIYLNGERKQYLHQRAEVITYEHIPPAWRRAPVAYIGSIDQEIDPSVFYCFDPSVLLGVMPQGFFRRWDENGLVQFTTWNPTDAVLGCIDVLVISELDVPDPDQLVREWGRFIDTIVVTHAARGATAYRNGEPCHYPTRPAQELDPTGAGDVFTAAYMVRFVETGDPCQAAHFANTVASFSVEGHGVAGIPMRQEVEAYLDEIE
jgi:sugar/nucleoside kinase (ribokinase family)